MSKEWKRIWKEAVVAQSRCYLGISQPIFRIKSRALALNYSVKKVKLFLYRPRRVLRVARG
jgi:hypothetical protein